MKKGPVGQSISSHSRITLFAVAFALVVCAQAAHAQSAAYWCVSGQGAVYWSSQPCLPGQSVQGYGYNQYQYGYPYNYYPANYYPYGNPGYQYYPQPTCSISYSATNNPNYWSGGMYAQAIQLTWSSNYATNAYINGVGSVSPSGIRVVYPYGYSDYTMTAYGPGGTATCRTYYQPAAYYPQWQPNYWQQIGYNGYYYSY